MKVKVLVSQLCWTLCNIMDCSLPGSSPLGILEAKILEWGAILFSRDLHNPGIKPGSPAFHADSLLYESPNHPSVCLINYKHSKESSSLVTSFTWGYFSVWENKYICGQRKITNHLAQWFSALLRTESRWNWRNSGVWDSHPETLNQLVRAQPGCKLLKTLQLIPVNSQCCQSLWFKVMERY